jgi:sugar lactone lactonase YvrE
MGKQGCLYVSDAEKNEVRRFTRGDTKGIVVVRWIPAKTWFQNEYDIFVDEEQSLYVSDHWNHRVMKWLKGAKEGIVVAGGKEQGKELTQLNCPRRLWVDEMGRVYVAEGGNNHRVTRWPKGETRGIVVVSGNGCGNATNQFKRPSEVSFDRRRNMYVVDFDNHGVQRFKLENN